ncbi:hypothetical protein JXQ70_15875 [bacterium]|nr:hypothetical protein [bacterium]
MKITQKLSTILQLIMIIGMLSCATTPTKELEKKEKKMEPVEQIDLAWIDQEVDFSKYTSVQVPDFSGEALPESMKWLEQYVPEHIALTLGKDKVFELVDRSPQVSGPWTDLVLKGSIMIVKEQLEDPMIIEVTCQLFSNRLKELVALMKHSKRNESTSFDNHNEIKTMVDELSREIVLYIHNQKDISYSRSNPLK